MNLSQLRYFHKLAEVQHYTKAAEELFITQPALSNSIKQLEKELGIPLFESQGRNVRLTKWGKEFSTYVEEGLNVIDKGIQVAQEHADNLSGTIDVGTIFTVQSDYLPGLLKEYKKLYGNKIEIKLFQGLTRGLIKGLENGNYDLVISAYMENKPNLEFVNILYQHLIVVVDRNHPLAAKSRVSLSDLAEYPIATYREETPIGDKIHELVEPYNLSIKDRCDDEISLGSVVSSNSKIVGLSLNTLGLAPFPELVKITINEVPKDFHPIYMVYRKNSYKTRALENLIELGKTYQYSK